ncbi:unnamed protein product [Fraxinus pennsylvanica]|uniref:TOD1/MUCI70 glycosyltransferase-like domain-containing protein n=1 Tax=Fraxinus pennsylvanica TaxID=56036 RepID=A0AAD2DIU6_9LAMI|nr:unnamed protein product [Fraxinus pennsylvanica]
MYIMFVDEQTLAKLSAEGNGPDDKGNIVLWKIVVVRNLPYEDVRRTGKVPNFLSHRLFPSARYSIWLDSKLRLNADPMLIIEPKNSSAKLCVQLSYRKGHLLSGDLILMNNSIYICSRTANEEQ